MAVNIKFPEHRMHPLERQRGTIINRLLHAGHGAINISGHENQLIDNALGFTHLVFHPNEFMTHLVKSPHPLTPSHHTGR